MLCSKYDQGASNEYQTLMYKWTTTKIILQLVQNIHLICSCKILLKNQCLFSEHVPVSLDEKTASAVNILQHIIDMSNQGAFSQAQTDGTPPILTVNQDNILTLPSETVIVHQDGEELVVANGDGSLDNQQYVIQYVTQQEEGQLEEMSMVEVQTDGSENVVLEGLQTDGQAELHTEIHTVEAS